jgi:aminocarboxymuconate-semialdehyde decarboxylase
LATLPIQAPEAAAVELERAVSDLGFVGAQIGTNFEDGRPLDVVDLEPVYAAADRLGVPLMLHPYYLGAKPRLEDYYLTNSIGQPLDTCIAAARLMYSGVFDRFTNLKIVLVHGGGYMPYQLGRLDRAFEVRDEPKVRTDRKPSSYLHRFWMDTVTHSDAALSFLVSLIGTERIVLGTDLPFDMGDPRPLDRIERVGIDRHALGQTTAKLLRLSD